VTDYVVKPLSTDTWAAAGRCPSSTTAHGTSTRGPASATCVPRARGTAWCERLFL